MQSKAASVKEYLASLPEDRRKTVEAVRAVILKNLGKGFEERMQYGMIGYCVPHGVYPAGYHCDPKQPLPFACLASQKNYVSLYLMFVYLSPEDEAEFREAWTKTGKKLDMGKSCVRFKTLDDVPLEVVGRTIRKATVKKFVERYEAALQRTPARKAGAKPVRASKAVAARKAGAGSRKSASRR
ncbi:MAG TPA: DUF1801 domain-containing protein [Phycisphaerales bacterium]|nr:DUF1801 domain-containing protein [Phycisphaerales bacterium]